MQIWGIAAKEGIAMSREPKETKFDIAVQQWFHAITGHFTFSIFLGAWHFVSLLPIAACVWFFVETGGIVFLAAAIPFAAISGGIWASIHGMNRQLQFGHTTYLFKELWKHIRQNFVQGAHLGVLLLLVCAVLYLPLLIGQMLQKEIPFGFLCVIMVGSVLLPIMTDYTFYQISHWEIKLFLAIRNSISLMLRVGWKSIAVCVIWIVYCVLTAIFPLVLAPLSLFCGLTSVLNMTTQALYVPKIDSLMTNKSCISS